MFNESFNNEIYFKGNRIAEGFSEMPGVLKLVDYVGFFSEKEVLDAINKEGYFTKTKGDYSIRVWLK